MSKNYDPKDWYWIVGGDNTKAYSSKVGDYVLAADSTFVAWKSDGTNPTRIASEAELGEVLAPYQIRPVAAGVLDGYASSLSDGLVAQTVFKILFNHENRIRTLAGQPQLTVPQFRAIIKALM